MAAAAHLSPIVRTGEAADASACAAIYAPYVEGTVISFEQVAPSVELMGERITSALATHAWLVLEDPVDGQVLGYAYGGPYKERAAYAWSCEVSVYVDRGRQRSGHGRALYLALFERLARRGYRTAVAGMTLPNPASQGLHRSMGFEDVGTWREIGWKSGAWHDVHWMQRSLVPDEARQQGPSELT